MKLEHYIIPCACNSPHHTLQFMYDAQDNELYISIHLTNLSFFKRVWFGLKYIVGYQASYGHFEECIFNNTDCDKMIELFNKIKDKAKNV